MKLSLPGALAVLLALLLLPGLGAEPPVPEGAADGDLHPALDAAPATGTIEGEVLLPDRPARRVAERYAGAGRGASQEQPPVPAVAHIHGAVGRGPGAARDGAPTLVQRDTAFVPGLLVVPLGAEASFPNEDPFFHNVFSYSRPKRFDLGRYPRGESKSVTFDAPGYLKVFCEIHRWMRAGILVVENPHHAVVGDDGRFTLSGVPAGTHTLVVTDFDRGAKEVEVRVPDGGTVQVQVDFGR